MLSHELAKQLLKLPNKEVVIVTAAEGPYTADRGVHPGGPWEDKLGSIRIQVVETEDSEDARTS